MSAEDRRARVWTNEFVVVSKSMDKCRRRIGSTSPYHNIQNSSNQPLDLPSIRLGTAHSIMFACSCVFIYCYGCYVHCLFSMFPHLNWPSGSEDCEGSSSNSSCITQADKSFTNVKDRSPPPVKDKLFVFCFQILIPWSAFQKRGVWLWQETR